MDPPEALLDDQHRNHTEPKARRPLTSFPYRLLVVRGFNNLIVVVDMLAVFAVGKASSTAQNCSFKSAGGRY
jgi:hypothetical protein